MKDIRERFNIKNKNRKSETSTFSLWEVMVISIALVLFSSVLTGFLVNRVTERSILDDEQLKDIKDTYQQIIKAYYEDVDKEALADGAISGMMDYLDERYSTHMDLDESSSLEEKLEGNYQGVGIEITKREDKVLIVTVFSGSPAEKSGLKVGDYIIQVGDLVVDLDTTLEMVTSTITNQKEIDMKILRDDEELDVTVKIQKIEMPVVTGKIFKEDDKRIGYIYLKSFTANSYDQFKDELEELESEGIDSLIIDVRSNTGGYLTSVNDIASLFLKKGKVIYSLESKDDKTVTYDKTKTMREYPIVVLVDGATASASEILAAALKESYGALLVGKKTYGKGKVQETSKLSDDTLVKYTTAKWFTPSGDSIDGVGLVVGIDVSLTVEYLKDPSDENDAQLQKALEFLRNVE